MGQTRVAQQCVPYGLAVDSFEDRALVHVAFPGDLDLLGHGQTAQAFVRALSRWPRLWCRGPRRRRRRSIVLAFGGTHELGQAIEELAIKPHQLQTQPRTIAGDHPHDNRFDFQSLASRGNQMQLAMVPRVEAVAPFDEAPATHEVLFQVVLELGSGLILSSHLHRSHTITTIVTDLPRPRLPVCTGGTPGVRSW